MRHVDLVVIGAGIHGAGVAQAAAAAGHSVTILEKRAPGSGTSGRSSKLIHGGLRYLETGQFRLVRESLRERTLMLRNAPELVRLQPFLIPVYRATRRRPWQLRIGLAMYALLGGFGPGTSFRTVPRSEWAGLDGLETRGLETVLEYHDGQTDDAALTRAVVKSALDLGTELVMPAEFIATELVDDGVIVHYRQHTGDHALRARVVVNATGPWAIATLQRALPQHPLPAVELVQGTHIVLTDEPKRGIYYVESPHDGRVVFVMPWHGRTLVGTTETAFAGDPDEVRPLQAEIDYLLHIVRHYFPRYRGAPESRLLESFAGLRVLPASSANAFARSRETLLSVDRADRPRVLSILGGKLTGWRATGEQVLRRVAPSLPVRNARADTRLLRLDPVDETKLT